MSIPFFRATSAPISVRISNAIGIDPLTTSASGNALLRVFFAVLHSKLILGKHVVFPFPSVMGQSNAKVNKNLSTIIFIFSIDNL